MGLLRGMARTAVVAGTATAVSNRVSRRQAERWSAESPEGTYAEPTQTNEAEAEMAQLEKLGQLKEQGILTQAEFEAKKRQILGL